MCLLYNICFCVDITLRVSMDAPVLLLTAYNVNYKDP